MQTDIDTLYGAGAHFGYTRARRHPSASPFIFATRDQTDIFDLEETLKRLNKACEFISELSRAGGQILIVSGKNESLGSVREAAERIGVPFVAGRWIGGTLTNFKNIRKRIERLQKLTAERESGALEKYTKKERLLIDREIEELTARFGGVVTLEREPAALVIVDTRAEMTAVREANQLGIPVVGLASSDCDFAMIKYPIPANDTSVKAVRLIVDKLAEAYQEGKKAQSTDVHKTQINSKAQSQSTNDR